MDFLLISASFFGYAKEIKSALESRGRSVLWYEDRPSQHATAKALLRVAPSLMRTKSAAYFAQVMAEARQHPIRDVLVIKGEALSPKMIRALRDALPQARFTLYFWDSYRNMPADSPEKVALFDRAFSFDPGDVAQDPRLMSRPLFYLDEYARLRDTAMRDIDVLFIGTAHSDRYAVLKRIQAAMPKNVNFQRVLFMPSRLLYCMQRVLKPTYWAARREEFTFRALTKAQVMSLISRARIVVDIERTVQAGYTMRTIEMLGAARKIITTNKWVENADFYSPNNHLIVDRDSPYIPSDFLQTEWIPPKSDILEKYSLSGWLHEVLSNG